MADATITAAQQMKNKFLLGLFLGVAGSVAASSPTTWEVIKEINKDNRIKKAERINKAKANILENPRGAWQGMTI